MGHAAAQGEGNSLSEPLRRRRKAARLGFVNIVVPRAELEAETMALANRIAESDRFTLRMVKWAVNSAQDAMGFSTAIRNAHSHHMVLGIGGVIPPGRKAKNFRSGCRVSSRR